MIVMEVRHFAAVAGRVMDETTDKPVAGARVEIVNAPPAFRARKHPKAGDPDRASVLTGRDGHFHFLDLPEGNYEIQATVAGAPPASRKVPVARNAAGAKPENADMMLKIPPMPGAPPSRSKVKLDRRAREKKQ